MADRKCIVHVARNGLLNAHTRENATRKKIYSSSKITLTDFRSAGWLNDTVATGKTLENESQRLLDHLKHAAELLKSWLMPIHIKAFWSLTANLFHAKKTQLYRAMEYCRDPRKGARYNTAWYGCHTQITIRTIFQCSLPRQAKIHMTLVLDSEL